MHPCPICGDQTKNRVVCSYKCSGRFSNIKTGRVNTFEKFLTMYDTSGDCWLWQGTINNAGYGMYTLKGYPIQAHRYSYMNLVGIIPKDYQIDHLCRVRNCVNPKHLEAVTQQENHRRVALYRTHCPHGHPYDEKNTYFIKTGGRMCRECCRLRACVIRKKRLEKFAI